MSQILVLLSLLVVSSASGFSVPRLQLNESLSLHNNSMVVKDLLKQDGNIDNLPDESISDAKWLLTSPYLTQETLESLASSISDSDTTVNQPAIQELLYDGKKYKSVPQYESSQISLLPGSIVPGKRRLDEENIALASTGQTAANKFLMKKSDMFAEQISVGQKRKRSDQGRKMMRRFDQEETTPRRRRYQTRRIQVGEKASQNIVGNRRLSDKYRNELLSQQRQESKQKLIKPTVESRKQEEDDIFNDTDETEEAPVQPKRRSGVHEKAVDDNNDDDGEGEDDDGDDDRSTVRGTKQTRRRSASVTTRNGIQPDNRNAMSSYVKHNHPVSDRSVGTAGDDDIDSTNQLQRSSLIQPEDLVRTKDPIVQLHVDQPTEVEASLEDIDEASSANQLMHSSQELQAAAGHHHGHHDGYYQYAGVPKKKAWKFGFKRGNHKHTSECWLLTGSPS